MTRKNLKKALDNMIKKLSNPTHTKPIRFGIIGKGTSIAPIAYGVGVGGSIIMEGDVKGVVERYNRVNPNSPITEEYVESLLNMTDRKTRSRELNRIIREGMLADVEDLDPTTRIRFSDERVMDIVGGMSRGEYGKGGILPIVDGKQLTWKEYMAMVARAEKMGGMSYSFMQAVDRGETMRFIMATRTSREFAGMVRAVNKGEITRRQFRELLQAPPGMMNTQQAMDNLFNKVVPQIGIPAVVRKAFEKLTENMTASEFEVFYNKYRPVVDRMFISSDVNARDMRCYKVDGKFIMLEDYQDKVPTEDRHKIFAEFMDSLMEFKGVTVEELEERIGR